MAKLSIFSLTAGLLLLIPLQPKAQIDRRTLIDSMLTVLPFKIDDTIKLHLLNELSFHYFAVNPDSGIYRAQQALALAEKLNNQKGIATAYRCFGANYWEKEDFLRSQNFYWQSLKITEKAQDGIGIAKSLHGIATNYESQYDYTKALEYYQKSLETFRNINYPIGELGCLANKANIYEIEKKYDSAIAALTVSLELSKKFSTSGDAAFMSGQIGYINSKKNNYGFALKLEEQSLQKLIKYNYKGDVIITLGQIGEIFSLQKNYQQSLVYYKEAINTCTLLKDNYFAKSKAKYMVAAGNIYLQMAKDSGANYKSYLQKAAIGLQAAIDLCKKENEPEGLRDAYKALSKVQALQHNYADALQNFKFYTAYNDSLKNVANDKEAYRQELQYLYSKQKDSLNYKNKLQQFELHKLSKENEFEILALKQRWLYTIFAFIIFSFYALFVFFRYRTKQLVLKNELLSEKTNKKIKEVEHQKKLNDLTFAALRSQMNPHFIFNALNTIQSYVYLNDRKSAANYLGKFSELIRQILDNSSKHTISLSEEINLLKLYADIEKARFTDLSITIDIEETLDIEEILIPPMLIQPYVENAVKHGLLHQTGEKILTINIGRQNKECLEVSIEDNGIGRRKSMELNNSKHAHFSFANTANEQRINLLNEQFGKKANIEIIDKKNTDDTAAGTKVIIHLPLILAGSDKSPIEI